MTGPTTCTTRPLGIAAPGADVKGPQAFELDGGHVLVDTIRQCNGAEDLIRAAHRWRTDYVTLIVQAVPETMERTARALAGAAQAFDRVLICEASAARGQAGDAAAALERTVQAAARTECQRVGDCCRGLRHCIDAMLPGDVVVYLGADEARAVAILQEYGAKAVEDAVMGRHGSAAANNRGASGSAHA